MKALSCLLPLNAFVALLAGCSTTDIQPARDLYETGDFLGAASKIAEIHPQDEQGQQVQNRSEDNIWLLLEKGKMLMDAGRWQESNVAFLEADRIFRALDSEADVSLGAIRSGAGSLLIDDRQSDYVGNAYDRILLPAYMAINDMMMGDFDAAQASTNDIDAALADEEQARAGEAERLAEMDAEAREKDESWSSATCRTIWEEKYLARQRDSDDEGPSSLDAHLVDIASPVAEIAQAAAPDYTESFVDVIRQISRGAARAPGASLRSGSAYVIFEAGNVPKLEDRTVSFVYTYQAKAKDKNGNEKIVNVPSYVVLPFVGMGSSTGKSSGLQIETSAGTAMTQPMRGALEAVVAREFQDALPGINARIMLRALIQEAAQIMANEAGGGIAVLAGALLKSTLEPDLRGWQALGAQHHRATVEVPSDGVLKLSIPGSQGPAAAQEIKVPTGVPVLVYVRSTQGNNLIAHACPLASITP